MPPKLLKEEGPRGDKRKTHQPEESINASEASQASGSQKRTLKLHIKRNPKGQYGREEREGYMEKALR